MTGSGKTTLARELLTRLRDAYRGARVYILDTKDLGDFDEIDGYRVRSQEPPDVLRSPGGVQVWQPEDEVVDDFNLWFKKILNHRQPAIVVVDELGAILDGNKFPEYYRKLQKTGRAAGIATVSLTQEAAYIPRTTLGQASHVVRFRLLDDYDVRKIDKLVGRPKEEFGKDLPDTYGFFHRRVDQALGGHYYKNWQEFLGG